MKIGVYNITNNPLPQLNIIKYINVNRNIFEKIEDIVEMLNKELKLDILDSEHIYVLSLTYGLIPRGIIQAAVGDNEECPINIRGMAIGLLLTGAEQFIVFHNHPGGNRIISESDYICTDKYNELAKTLGMECSHHIMVTQNYFDYCERKNEDMPFK